MNFLILSDSHGRTDRIKEALELHSGVDYVVFLGDGLRDLPEDMLDNKRLLCVRGNCDFFANFGSQDVSSELILNFGEYTVMLAHGHTLGVKGSIEVAAAEAAKRGADILLFGHTHEPLERYIPAGEVLGDLLLNKPLRLFNPGSIGAPRGGTPSFGLLQIRGRDILFSHGGL